MRTLRTWTVADSLELYNIRGWGQGYFGIAPNGHLMAYPHRNGSLGIDLRELVEDARSQGLGPPLLIRFSDVLSDRLKCMQQAFHAAIAEHDYQGRYRGVYPLKVNQQRQVVEEIVSFGDGAGSDASIGLEVGSKPELHAALATLENPGTLVICNGYKDESYVRLALLGSRLGRPVFLVVEKLAELPLILRLAKEEGVPPLLGLRLKLSAQGSGRWEDSGGDHSKFGLTSWEVVQAVEELRKSSRLDCLRLLHAHLGSQVNNIRHVRDAVTEVARYYTELRRLGCPVDHLDMGGGLGVDYDGTRSASEFSVNYTEEEYAKAIVSGLESVCRNEELPHPDIITESGRALTAHHAMLVVNVLEAARLVDEQVGSRKPEAPEADLPEPLVRLNEIRNGLSPRNFMEYWHEALHVREEANKMFELGYLSLDHRARADRLFWGTATTVLKLAMRQKRLPEELEALQTRLADKYFCNFSVFQSLPDSWAIGQEFPVVPLHRLNEEPTRQGIVQDITCDSDGRIASYISLQGVSETLPLHEFRQGEPYFLGVFLTGAYQEILGDLHNLFGDTDAIHVALNEDGSWHYEQVIRGENLSKVLTYVQFHKDLLIDRMERQVNQAVRQGILGHLDGKRLLDHYIEGLEGPTYLGASSRLRFSRRQPSKSHDEEAV
ncbi:MAG: biosynthetic arginine decarboxylase [Deltaproteobacteria bacterium]|nr:biosynthetic arginine decarboxylase [Deltaproteobacteria bacterium]